MKKYTVFVKEIHRQGYYIEADSPEDAIIKIEDGDGDLIDSLFEFDETLRSDTWNVEEGEV